MENRRNAEEPLVFAPTEVLARAQLFGQKTVRLAQCHEHGYRVPAFVAISIETVQDLVYAGDPQELLMPLVSAISRDVVAQRYAVRSSAQGEDGGTHSHAGAFMTKLDVSPHDIGAAIHAVIAEAQAKGYATVAHPFSLIIQAYVEPDIAGVIFSRNPLGGYEMVVEWKEGNGADVVGGGASERLVFSCKKIPSPIPFAGFGDLVALTKKLEQEYDAPQDVEWAIIKGVVYVLQTRPITTISESRYRALRFLDVTIAADDFYYDQTTLADSFTKPYPLARDILLYLYQKDGAIAVAYKRFHIQYEPESMIQVFKNTLYIDKQAELQNFFPTHSYFGTASLSPRIVTLRGLWTTLRNVYYLQQIPTHDWALTHDLFRAHVQKIRQMASQDHTFSDWLLMLVAAYTDIFAVNIIAEKVFKKLDSVLKNTPYKAHELLGTSVISSVETHASSSLLSEIEGQMVGNSLNIGDESVFRARMEAASFDDEAIQRWWQQRSTKESADIKDAIHSARQYEILREEGRWITVMCLSGLRNALRTLVGLEYEHFMYYLTLDEARTGRFDKESLEQRKSEYEVQSTYEFPQTIASVSTSTLDTNQGVSSGVAEGVLVAAGDVMPEGSILLVDTLDPKLTMYFDRIAGIISKQGGILSHLAIVAREYRIPVVVAPQKTLRVGERVRIDGAQGTIQILAEI